MTQEDAASRNQSRETGCAGAGDAEGPAAGYRALCEAGRLRFDPAQAHAAARLQALHESLAAPDTRRGGKKRRSWRLFGGGSEAPPAAPGGLYLFGGVGRGKTLLMDLFFEGAATPAKRRVHYHAFMQEVHRAINRAGLAGGERATEIFSSLTADIARDARLLCFDEFHVSDIGDAMILGRLFHGLLDAGVTAVMTSNHAPDALYEGGINRQNFVPFIELVKARMEVLELDGAQDYRQLYLREARLYHTPLSAEADTALALAFRRLTGDATPAPATIEVPGGRTLTLKKTAKGVAMAHFDELCARPLGAVDYLALQAAFHTLILNGIPRMGPALRNEAKRFATLLDVLYEHRVHLICAADAPPDELYPAGDGAFDFKRTASRLTEMRSAAYVAAVHRP